MLREDNICEKVLRKMHVKLFHSSDSKSYGAVESKQHDSSKVKTVSCFCVPFDFIVWLIIVSCRNKNGVFKILSTLFNDNIQGSYSSKAVLTRNFT